MFSGKQIGVAFCAAAISTTFIASSASAREPGVLPSIPPGHTIGLPTGATPPPGLYYSAAAQRFSGEVFDDDGNGIGTDVDVTDFTSLLTWVPGNQIWGGNYYALMSLPYLDLDVDTPGPSFGSNGLGRMTVTPIGLSWEVNPGVFVSTDLTFALPTASFDPNEVANRGGDFWSIMPSVAVTSFRGGWTNTVHATYITSTESDSTDYQSGDEILINGTFLKNFNNGWSAGPVGFYMAQITGDENNGSFYGGTIGEKYRIGAIGLGVNKQVGPMLFHASLTDEVYTRNSVGGTTFAFKFSIPLSGKPANAALLD